MGVNSKAIERIDEQIRMLDEDYASNNNSSVYEESISEDDSTTLKIDSIDDLDDVEVLDDDSNITKKDQKIELIDNDNTQKVNEEDTEDGVNIFLMYYVGIILIAIVLLIIIYFLFT